MPAKPKKPVQRTQQQSFRGFLNIQLTEEDKTIIKSTSYDMASWQADLDKWIDNGFKFTLGYDAYSHCFQCIGTRSDRDHVDFGILLTGRGSTSMKSFKQWIYIQTRLIGDADWSSLLEAPPSKELDD